MAAIYLRASIRVGLLLTAMVVCFPVSATSPAEAELLAERSESSLSAQQRTALVEAQGSMAASAFRKCARHLTGKSAASFTIVAELDSRGKVIATWQRDSTAFSACFRDVMRSELMFVPPSLPFYTAFEYSPAK